MDAARRAQLRRSLAALAEGDRSALTPVFELSWPVLRELAVRLVGPADAEDAAQQALLKLAERAPAYDASREALPWMLAFVANECRTIRKRTLRRREDTMASAPEPSAPEDVAEALLQADLRRAAREVLQEMDAADVEVLVQAASEDGLPLGATLRKRLQRARQRLRTAWRARHGLV